MAKTPTSYILMVFFVKNAVLGLGLGFTHRQKKKIDPVPGPAFYLQPSPQHQETP